MERLATEAAVALISAFALWKFDWLVFDFEFLFEAILDE